MLFLALNLRVFSGVQGPTSGGVRSWAEVVNPVAMAELSIPEAESQLCPYGAASAGDCPYGLECEYVHGEACDMCGRAALHPTHQEQRNCHMFVS